MSQKYRCRQNLSGKKMFLTVFCFRTYPDLPAFEGHPDPHLSVDQRQHIHRQSADGVVNGLLFSQTGDQMADPQRMCRRVVIKFVADGIDKI